MGEQDGFSKSSEFEFMIGKGADMGSPLRAVFGLRFGWRDER